MRYEEFELEFRGHPALREVKPGTLRQWKLRGVPDRFVTRLRAQSVTPAPVVTAPSVTKGKNGVTKSKSVTKNVTPGVTVGDFVTGEVLSVAIPSAEAGHPEFDIMGDGWARGFGGDVPHLRMMRTVHAIRRMAEAQTPNVFKTAFEWHSAATPLAKTKVAIWEASDKSTAEGRLACLRELAGTVQKVEKRFATHEASKERGE